MKKIDGYDEAQTYTGKQRLPVGGYVLKILDVKYEDNSEKGWSDRIILSFDIAEGEQEGFYQKQYDSQTYEDKKWKGTYRIYVPTDDGSERDNWTMRRFKTIMTDFEDSNPKFHWDWDETKLKGKLIGGIFNEKEYDFNGKTGFFTNCYALTTTDKIRSGAFTIPEPTMLKKDSPSESGGEVSTDFMNVPEGDSEVPFN